MVTVNTTKAFSEYVRKLEEKYKKPKPMLADPYSGQASTHGKTPDQSESDRLMKATYSQHSSVDSTSVKQPRVYKNEGDNLSQLRKTLDQFTKTSSDMQKQPVRVKQFSFQAETQQPKRNLLNARLNAQRNETWGNLARRRTRPSLMTRSLEQQTLTNSSVNQKASQNDTIYSREFVPMALKSSLADESSSNQATIFGTTSHQILAQQKMHNLQDIIFLPTKNLLGKMVSSSPEASAQPREMQTAQVAVRQKAHDAIRRRNRRSQIGGSQHAYAKSSINVQSGEQLSESAQLDVPQVINKWASSTAQDWYPYQDQHSRSTDQESIEVTLENKSVTEQDEPLVRIGSSQCDSIKFNSHARVSRGAFQMSQENRHLLKIKPEKVKRRLSAFYTTAFHEKKVFIKPKYQPSPPRMIADNSGTRNLIQKQMDEYMAEYLANKSRNQYKQSQEARTSMRFNEIHNKFMNEENYRSLLAANKALAWRQHLEHIIDPMNARRRQVLAVKRNRLQLKEEVYQQQLQKDLQTVIGQEESEEYHSASSNDTHPDQEMMILGQLEIPECTTAAEINYEDLFQANDNDLMSLLDPATAKRMNQQKKNMQKNNKERHSQLVKQANFKLREVMSPRREKLLRMFVQSFFADLGNTSDFTIEETRKFLKKQEIDVSKYVPRRKDEASPDEEDADSVQQQQKAQMKDPAGQLTSVNKATTYKQERMEKTLNKIKYFKELKQSKNSGQTNAETDANLEYARDLKKQGQGSSMAPSKIVDRKLLLESYHLSDAVANSLGSYFTKLPANNSLQELTLVDNGLKDLATCQLLAGISSQRALRKLHISKNEVGNHSAQEIVKILLWQPPFHLQDLLMEDLQINDFAIATICQILKSAKKLSKLQFSRVQLNSQMIFDYIAAFVKTNKEINVLKLAWACFSDKQLYTLSRMLPAKERLTHLDLSYNNIQTGSDSSELLSSERSKTTPGYGFVSNIRKLIMKSQLFHLNLSGMNLGRLTSKLVEPIRISTSLNAVHLSANNLPRDLIHYLDSALKVPHTDPPEYKISQFREQQERTDIQPQETVHEEDKSDEEKAVSQQMLDRAVKQLEQRKAEIASQLESQLAQNPLIYQRVIDMPEFTFPNRFVARKNQFDQSSLQRLMQQQVTQQAQQQSQNPKQFSEYFTQESYLRWQKLSLDEEVDLQKEMLEALQHQMDQIKNANKSSKEYQAMLKKKTDGGQEETNVHERQVRHVTDACWACDKRKQILMVVQRSHLINEKWGELVTDHEEIKRVKARYLPKRQMPDMIQGLPILVSSLNDWFPCHFMHIVPFSMFFDPILAEELQGSKQSTKQTRVEKFEHAYQQILLHASNDEPLPADIVRQYSKTWRETIIQGLQYLQDTLFVDFPSHTEAVDLENTFAFSIFAKPGKHKVYIYEPQSRLWYFKNLVVPQCSFDQPNVKIIPKAQVNKKGLSSIFKERKKDSVQFFREAFQEDEKAWKVGRLVKDSSEYKECRDTVARHYDKIHEVFISLAARSKFPNIDLFTISTFCQETGILDGHSVNVSAIDRMFIAANVSLNQAADRTIENLFMRHQFLEFLVRIADLKFKQTKTCKTAGESFQKLMNDHILPFFTEYSIEGLYQRETYLQNTIIDHNLFHNRKLFEHLYAQECSRSQKKSFLRENASNVVYRLQLSLPESLVTYCWALSKLPVKDDEAKQNNYKALSFIEFVEFVARAMHLKMRFGKDHLQDSQQADFLLMNRLQLKRDSNQLVRKQPTENEILQEVFELNDYIRGKMVKYTETQKGLEWVDDDMEPSDRGSDEDSSG